MELAQFKPGMVVITAGDRHSLVSKAVAWSTGSWWTHNFIVTGPDEAVEAYNPRVRVFRLSDRLAALTANGQPYVVLDLPNITDAERSALAVEAKEYLGRPYNNLQALCYALFRVFWRLSSKEFICSSLITHVFQDALNLNLFGAPTPLTLIATQYYRAHNLHDGYVTPVELLMFSGLTVIYPT